MREERHVENAERTQKIHTAQHNKIKKKNMYYNYLNTSFRSQAIILSELNFWNAGFFRSVVCVFFSRSFVRCCCCFFSSLVLLHFVSFFVSVVFLIFLNDSKQMNERPPIVSIIIHEPNAHGKDKAKEFIGFRVSFCFIFVSFIRNLISLYTHFLCAWNGNVKRSYISWHSKRMTSCHDVPVSLF